MKNEMPDDPIQEAISAMEKQQEDDKQGTCEMKFDFIDVVIYDKI